jgi:serine/threonine-protein kinase RsbT
MGGDNRTNAYKSRRKKGIPIRRAAAEDTLTELSVTVCSERDLEEVRTKAKGIALAVGFVDQEVPYITTAASILARNVLGFEYPGQIILRAVYESPRYGVVVIAQYEGPDLPEVDMAMQNLRVGLSGMDRFMDEFNIYSNIEQQTAVIVMKWLRSPSSVPPRLDRDMLSIP